ncbi:MAG: exosome complex exonuclease Rrp41 [Candidatus Aenigmarchaeota archaeon]|nr:exosome complex exonuclease Rrp41 [Candidatus Aenigmarchaeota archaeon]
MARKDGRKADEMREVKMEVGVLRNADGSARVQIGKTIAVASVFGPRELHPKHLQDNEKAVLNCIYMMAPFSTTERVRPGPSRRSHEISLVTKSALEKVVNLKDHPKAVIDVYILIEQANAGTRTAGINAASLALADAGIQMSDLVTSIASGKVDGEYVIDLSGDEEKITGCDLPVAYLPRSKEITLLQMDGDLSKADVKGVLKMCIRGCEKLHKIQVDALKKKWEAETSK